MANSWKLNSWADDALEEGSWGRAIQAFVRRVTVMFYKYILRYVESNKYHIRVRFYTYFYERDGYEISVYKQEMTKYLSTTQQSMRVDKKKIVKNCVQ